jgi:uncharacterized protein
MVSSPAPSNADALKRIHSIDVVRGFALLGILVMNVQAFAMPVAAYFNPRVCGGFEGLDRAAWLLTRLLFDVKFLSIFSTLFGASLILAGRGFAATKRLLWLVVFGLVHGYTLYFGDILFTYGVVGLLVVHAWEWPVPRLVSTGLVLLLAAVAVHVFVGAAWDVLPAWIRDEVVRTVSDREAAAQIVAFRGDWRAQLETRAALAFNNHVLGTLFESGWQAAGCMMLGMAAMRSGFFEGGTGVHRRAPVFGLAGLTLTAAGIALSLAFDFAPRAWLFGQALHLAGSIGVTWGWLVVLVAFARGKRARPLVESVARLGRVAFSAYILQSIGGALLFGGHGLGLYGTVSRRVLLLGPLAFWTFELVLANAWTRAFRVGPLEALWRGLYRGEFSLGAVRPGDASAG